MSDDCNDFGERIKYLEGEISSNISPRINKMEVIISQLTADVSEIKIRFPDLATKRDLLETEGHLITKIDTSIIDLLKDSINAVPPKIGNYWQKQNVIWQAIAALATIGSAILAGHLFYK